MSPGIRCAAILLAGGSGERLGPGAPKQFQPLAGQPMLLHSLKALAACPEVLGIVMVVPAARPAWVDAEAHRDKVVGLVDGGPSRQASLERGMLGLPEWADAVAVHDAARPMLRPNHLSHLIGALNPSCSGVIPAIRLEDAIKSVTDQGRVVSSLPRRGVWRAQTPQVFYRAPLEAALALAGESGIAGDDCSDMLLRAGLEVRVSEGDPGNFKVTTRADMQLAELVLADRMARAGEENWRT
jgi:2-C-methyl-D-erythritol 4-phosphate cytidylyltransferase